MTTDTLPIEDILANFLTQGSTLKDLEGIKPEQLEAIYATGFMLYKNGRYEDAEKMFQSLCMFNHLETRFWIALGSSRQMQKKYATAIDAYGMAYLLNAKSPEPILQAAQCHLHLNHLAEAKEALELVIQTAASNTPIKAQAEQLLQLITTL